jgi:hypothetical protein
MNVLKSLAQKLRSSNRRKADRRESPSLKAYFWNGDTPAPHGIRDISSTGFYLVTKERWYPGTVVMVTLQKTDEPEGSPARTIKIQSRAMRWGEDGVGLQFLATERSASSKSSIYPEGADRKTLDLFLRDCQAGKSNAVVNYVLEPAKRIS